LSFIITLFIAFALDILIGDPHWLPHPVRWIGRAVIALEGRLRGAARSGAGRRQRVLGAVLTVIIAGGVYVASWLALVVAGLLSGFLFYLLAIYIIWMCLSLRSLRVEACSVLWAMKEGNIELARERLSRIVGRDTHALSASEVYRAVAETVAENTSDGVVAPLFYLALGGPALMLAYKAVNTLDSMVGYRNAKYVDFGWSSARLDDVANYIPARLTGFIMVGASFMLGYDWRGAYDTVMRDGRNHSSPNAGFPEAAVAGATGVRFGGPMSYGGVEELKPFIGDGSRGHGPGTVAAAIRILTFTSFIFLIVACFLRIILYGIF